MDCENIQLKMVLEEIKSLEEMKNRYQRLLNFAEAELLNKHKLARDLANG